MYAIIEDSGTQIKVSEGDVIRVDTRDLPEDTTELTFDRVLLVGGEEPRIGQPAVAGAKVTAEILAEDVSEKTEIFKFKRRKKYRRHNGHRQHFIQVRISRIEA
ncbi:MAG: 50S ribosomal protein L21 [Phycisphaeraceae bacterium]